MKNLKVIFMGTPSFAVPILEALIENCQVVLVVSQPDRVKDRKGNLLPTPIKEVALKNNITVFQPEKLKDEIDVILKQEADIIVTCAYGQILPEVLLDAFEYKAINVHGSLLPKLRGGAPIHRAIIEGEKETGITIMYMDKKMDAGDIILQKKIPIFEEEVLDSLYNRMSLLGKEALLEALSLIVAGNVVVHKQDENQVTYGLNIKKEEEKINFNKSACDVCNLIRGLSSVPGAYCFFNEKRLKVYNAAIINEKASNEPGIISGVDKDGLIVDCIDKKIKITDIRIEGKKRCLVKDYLNGIDKEALVGRKLY